MGRMGDQMSDYSEMCCEVCAVHVSQAAMHRANPKGEKGRWRCARCLGKRIDPLVLSITDAIGGVEA